jgi:hypothetical protein
MAPDMSNAPAALVRPCYCVVRAIHVRLCASCACVPTQFKATQLVVAMAVWAIAFSESRAKREATSTYRLYFSKASEQYYITIGQQCIVSIG